MRIGLFNPHFLLEASDHAETREKKKSCAHHPITARVLHETKVQSIQTQKVAGVGEQGKMGSMPLLLLSLLASMLSLVWGLSLASK